MLNMQNVKDIEITEGNVRTIHDKDNHLIWGRLNYDTKYAGDTYQQTYSGKNLFDYNANRYGWHASVVATSELYSVECTAPQSSYVFILVPNSSDLLGKTATICAKDVVSNTSGRGGRIVIYQSSSSTLSSISSTAIVNINGTGELKDTFTFPNTFDSGKDCFVVGLYAANIYSGVQAGEKTTYKYLQLEVNSSSTNFEPYTGGIPAPNPDYPQDVQVVTGEQTVTVSDGVDSEAFPISLGTIELCKIGTYQDYIYKSGDDWYVHKEFGKYVFNGSETIAYNSSNKGFTINTTNLPNYMPNHATPPMVGLSSHFSVNSTTSTWTADNRIGLSSAGTFWCKATSFATSESDCLTWLTAHTPSVYYALDTATDTKITDATLVGQLNAVHEWLTRYGYNATVIGNLPIVINQTNL